MAGSNSSDMILAELEYFVTSGGNPYRTNNSTKITTPEGRYVYVPFAFSDFVVQVETVLKLMGPRPYNKPVSFIDAGCGIATKLKYLSELFYANCKLDVYGIEVHKPYVEIAKKFAPKAKIILGDAIEHDYKPYDIIYFYSPLADVELEKKLEKRIFETAKKGAYIIGNYQKIDAKGAKKFKVLPVFGNNIQKKF